MLNIDKFSYVKKLCIEKIIDIYIQAISEKNNDLRPESQNL